MTNRKKAMLMMFADYLLCLFLQILGLFIFSWMLSYSWGYPVYSALFSLILFGLLYSRAHNTAKSDLKQKDLHRTAVEGLILATPLAAFNLLLILLFALIQSNTIPIRDIVMSTVYSFPDNEPRVVTDVLLIDYITPFIRIWFGMLIGFMQKNTSAPLLLLSPALTLAAGFLGYLACRRKFYLSDLIFHAKEKVKDKFNE